MLEAFNAEVLNLGDAKGDGGTGHAAISVLAAKSDNLNAEVLADGLGNNIE